MKGENMINFNEKPIHATRCVCGKLIILNPNGLEMRCPLCNTYPTAVDAEKEGMTAIPEENSNNDLETAILDQMAEKYGAEAIGELVANHNFKITNIHCNCGCTAIENLKMCDPVIKCKYCGTFTTIIGYTCNHNLPFGMIAEPTLSDFKITFVE